MTEKPKLRKISCIFSQHFQITLLAIKDMKSKSFFVRPILHKPKKLRALPPVFQIKEGCINAHLLGVLRLLKSPTVGPNRVHEKRE